MKVDPVKLLAALKKYAQDRSHTTMAGTNADFDDGLRFAFQEMVLVITVVAETLAEIPGEER